MNCGSVSECPGSYEIRNNVFKGSEAQCLSFTLKRLRKKMRTSPHIRTQRESI